MSELVLRKQHEKELIITALELKQKLKGSVVRERVRCGKRGCKCAAGTLHGPYSYLHYYSAGKVKRKYLPKALGDLMRRSREELETMLHDVDAEILGQEKTISWLWPQEQGHDRGWLVSLRRPGHLAPANLLSSAKTLRTLPMYKRWAAEFLLLRPGGAKRILWQVQSFHGRDLLAPSSNQLFLVGPRRP